MRKALKTERVWLALSWLMVIGEAAGGVVIPFLIGTAVDDYLAGSWRGLIWLAAVGMTTMVLTTVRRLLDVRLFARVYQNVSASAYEQDSGLSAKTARLNMLREVVDFFEWSLPDLIASVSAFIGTLAFLFVLSFPVFLGAIGMSLIIVVVYALTTNRTSKLNQEYNNELERQVDVLQRNESRQTHKHIGVLNVWLIKLSDVDAVNIAISLTLTTILQVFAVITATNNGADAGTLLSIVMYVFEFSAIAAMLPISWQEYLRLRDILARLRTNTAS